MYNRDTIRVAKLLLQDTGTYNTIFSRPYETQMDLATLENITNRVDEYMSIGGNHNAVSGAFLSGLASNMVQPSATPQGELQIPNGWGERRVRFVLEVLVSSPTGSEYSYYIQGYTTHSGITISGNIDPQMYFIINSIVRVSRTQMMTAYGVQTTDIVTESSQVINGRIISSNSDDFFTVRPQDVFLGIHSGHLRNAYELDSPVGELYDRRAPNKTDSIRTTRSNNIPTNYLARVVDGYQTGSALLDFGQGSKEVLVRSQEYCKEPSLNENNFVRAISNIRGIPNSTMFTFGDLETLDPNVNAVTNYIVLGETEKAKLHQVGQSAYWDSADRETLMATVLSNAIPALMMELLIVTLSFRSTNHDITGTMNTVIEGATSLTNTDISHNLAIFKKRLEKEVLYDITYGNQELYTLSMSCNLMGDTYINLSIGGGSMVSYATPSFCDGLLTPMVSSNKDNYYNLLNDFEVLMGSLGRVENSFLAINTSI